MPTSPFARHVDVGLRHERARRLELARQAIEVLRVVLGAFAVLCLLVVARSAREVRGHAVAGHRAIRDAVAVRRLDSGPNSPMRLSVVGIEHACRG